MGWLGLVCPVRASLKRSATAEMSCGPRCACLRSVTWRTMSISRTWSTNHREIAHVACIAAIPPCEQIAFHENTCATCPYVFPWFSIWTHCPGNLDLSICFFRGFPYGHIALEEVCLHLSICFSVVLCIWIGHWGDPDLSICAFLGFSIWTGPVGYPVLSP